MNTAVNSLFPLTPSAPARASIDAGLRSSLRRAGVAVWRVLEAIGQARAEPHLRALADQCEALQPGLARELRAASRQGPMA